MVNEYTLKWTEEKTKTVRESYLLLPKQEAINMLQHDIHYEVLAITLHKSLLKEWVKQKLVSRAKHTRRIIKYTQCRIKVLKQLLKELSSK